MPRPPRPGAADKPVGSATGQNRLRGRPARTQPGTDSVLTGRKPIVEALKAGVEPEKIFIAQGSDRSAVIDEIRRRAKEAGIPVRDVPRAEIDKLAAGTHHQGVAAITGSFRYSDLNSLLAIPSACLLFLDHLQDPHNLGSLLRSADAAGFHGVVIPTKRAVAVTAAVRRVSAGAAEVVPVARVPSLSSSLERARRAGLWLVGLDHEATTSIWETGGLEAPVGLVMGSEDRGLSVAVRDACDELVQIPSAGKMESLNVGVAGALAMFEARRRATL